MIDGVLVIGVDGATLRVIQPLVEAGKLPAFSDCLGWSWGTLDSVLPPVSAAAWTSLVTGKRPGGHAIFDFFFRRPGTYEMRLSRGGDRGAEAIWSRLSRQGRRCCAINVTMSYPPDPVNGVMVSGLDCPWKDRVATHPEGLSEELTARIQDYVIVPRPLPSHARKERLEALLRMTQARTEAACWLANRETWDFFMVQYAATDVVQHFYWADWDPSHPARKSLDPLVPDAL